MITFGIDCGTQSTKTIAIDPEASVVLAQASMGYELTGGLPPGHAEQDPALWIEALDKTIRQVIHQLGERRTEVTAIGVSGQQHGFVPLDGEGRVIRPAKLWCDTSTTEECEIFAHEFGGSSGLIALTGLDILPGFTAPKILWLKRHEPRSFARLAHVLLPHDYLNFHLSGEIAMEYGDASGTALMDIRTRRWCPDLCAFIDPALESKLPVPGSSRRSIGHLRPELAKSWGLSDTVMISAGGGDNMMGAIGTGNALPGRVTASLGTSGTIFAYSKGPVIDPKGEIAAFCDSTDAWLPLLCTMNVTVATEQVRKLFAWSHADFDAAVESVPIGADGLIFLPYLQGERTPNLPHAQGSLHGLTLQNYTPAHLARATMEGVTLGMAYGLGRLRALGMKPAEIRLIGGGSKSPAWRTICANVFGCPVVTVRNPEGAAFGAAIQALSLTRPDKSLEEWSDLLAETIPSERTEPSGEAADLYQQLIERQITLAAMS